MTEPDRKTGGTRPRDDWRSPEIARREKANRRWRGSDNPRLLGVGTVLALLTAALPPLVWLIAPGWRDTAERLIPFSIILAFATLVLHRRLRRFDRARREDGQE